MLVLSVNNRKTGDKKQGDGIRYEGRKVEEEWIDKRKYGETDEDKREEEKEWMDQRKKEETDER